MHKGISSTLKRKRTASPAGPELTRDSDDKGNDARFSAAQESASRGPDRKKPSQANDHDQPSVSAVQIAVPKSGKTFRLRGIPSEWSEDTIREQIKTGLGLNKEVDVDILSLARSHARPAEKVATLEFSKTPAYTCGEAGKGEWQVNCGNKVLRLDTHFHNFTPLHAEEDSNCEIDLIAISGLNSHAFGSFKTKESSYMWLRDSLPSDLPRARIFIYGYDTQMEGSNSFQNISNLGSKFRAAIKIIRRTSQPDVVRPIVLVGHSLGGIVIKEAVRQMCNGD